MKFSPNDGGENGVGFVEIPKIFATWGTLFFGREPFERVTLVEQDPTSIQSEMMSNFWRSRCTPRWHAAKLSVVNWSETYILTTACQYGLLNISQTGATMRGRGNAFNTLKHDSILIGW